MLTAMGRIKRLRALSQQLKGVLHSSVIVSYGYVLFLRRAQVTETAHILSNLLLHILNLTEHARLGFLSRHYAWFHLLLEHTAALIGHGCCIVTFAVLTFNLIFLDYHFLVVIWNVQMPQIVFQLLISEVAVVNLWTINLDRFARHVL